jgi:hypothetical protein
VDRSVLVEVPERAVLVVADRRDRRHHQAAGASHVDLAGEQVGVLPQDAEVLLVQAHRVLDAVGLALAVGQPRIEVADGADAIAAERQGVGQHADAVLADVEGILAEVSAAGVPVRHDHLGQCRAMQHRPQPAAILVADGMQHQAFARVEAHPQAPLLPVHLVALDSETRALRLDNLQRPHVVAEDSATAGGIVAALHRHVGRAVVVDAQDFRPVEIDRRRTGPRWDGRRDCRASRCDTSRRYGESRRPSSSGRP